MELGLDMSTINTYIMKLCPYFKDLNPIMEDNKASTKPLYSNEDSDEDINSRSDNGSDIDDSVQSAQLSASKQRKSVRPCESLSLSKTHQPFFLVPFLVPYRGTHDTSSSVDT
jgi:hypothetical protein